MIANGPNNMSVKAIPGEYNLQGVREMASGFLLKPDGNFQFFFIYGGLDRHGEGKWVEKNGRVIFNSRPKPMADFTLVNSNAGTNGPVTIKMEGGNPMLLRHIFSSLENGAEGSWKQMSQEGEVSFPVQKVETVSLLLEFCPERFSTMAVPHPGHTEFIFRFEPTIMEVFFEDFSLQTEPEGLSGGHPLMEGDAFSYAKQ